MKKYQSDNTYLNLVLQLVLFLSGAVTLTFQLLWNRMLYPVTGMHHYATTAVLISFMAGLGLGSFIFGVLAAGVRNPSKLLGYICIALGLSGAGFPFLTGVMQNCFLSLIPLGTDPLMLNIARLSACILIFILPCTFMGGVFPVCSRFLSIEGVMKKGIPSAYSVYTGGAVSGSLLTGLVLIPLLNMAAISIVAGLIIIASGIIVMMLPGCPPSDITDQDTGYYSGAVSGMTGKRVFLLIFFTTGFITLSLEILWARSLSQLLGGTYTNFALILSGVLSGLWAGSVIYSKFLSERLSFKSLQIMAILLFVCIAATFIVLPELPGLMRAIIQWSEGSSAVFNFCVRLFSTLVMILPASLILGIIFPHALRLFSETGRHIVPGRIGISMAVNTVGAISGVSLTGLILIKYLGTGYALKVILVISILLIFMSSLVGRDRKRGFTTRIVPCAVTIFLIFSTILLFPEDLLYKNQLAGLASRIPGEKTVLFRGEDEVSTAVVIEENNSLLYYVDKGNVTSGTHRDIYHSNWRGVGGTHLYHWNITWAYLPCLIHPDPERILVIGYGTGRQTASIATFSSIEKIDVVEINPLNIRASSFFYLDAPGLFSDPRIDLYIDDGRNFLMRTDSAYDMIIVDVGGLYADGSEFFYTKEFLELMHSKLTPGGLALTWLPQSGLLGRIGRRYQKTINSVFESSSVWMGGRQDFYQDFMWIISSKKDIVIDYENLKRRWMNLTSHQYKELYLAGIKNPGEIFSFYLTSLKDLPEGIEKEEMLTDTKPYYIMPWEKGLPGAGEIITASFLSDPSFYDAGYEHLFFDRTMFSVEASPFDMESIRTARELQLRGIREYISDQVRNSLEDKLKKGKITGDIIERYLDLAGEQEGKKEINIIAESIKKIIVK